MISEVINPQYANVSPLGSRMEGRGPPGKIVLCSKSKASILGTRVQTLLTSAGLNSCRQAVSLATALVWVVRTPPSDWAPVSCPRSGRLASWNPEEMQACP